MKSFIRHLCLGILFCTLWSPQAHTVLDTKTRMPEFMDDLKWINSSPLKLRDLEGKIVIVYFWSLSSYESVNNIQMLNDLYDSLRDIGVQIIGTHVPQYEADKDFSAVQNLVTQWQVFFPVVLDDDHRMQGAYQSVRIPAFYISDTRNQIRKVFLETYSYQQIWAYLYHSLIPSFSPGHFLEIPERYKNLDISSWLTKNLSLGAQDLSQVGNPISIRSRVPLTFKWPSAESENKLYLNGKWRFEKEYAVPLKNEAAIRLQTRCRVVNVCAKSKLGSTAKMRVTLDGSPIPQEVRGWNIAEDAGETVIRVTGFGNYNVVRFENAVKVPYQLEFTIQSLPLELSLLIASDIPIQMKPLSRNPETPAEKSLNAEKIELSTTLE